MQAAPMLLVLASLLIAGCVDQPSATTLGTPNIDAASSPWQRAYLHDGALSPLAPTASYPFTVPDGAAEIQGTLTWREPASVLGFRLIDPAGEEAAAGWNEAPGRAYVTTTHPVEPGEWTIEIFSARPFAASFSSTVTVRSDAPPFGPIDTTFIIPPRDPSRALPPEVRAVFPMAVSRDYAEVNLNMRPGDAFNFSWTANSPVYFNVHFHGADGTQRPIEHRGDALEGNFSANMTEVYALLWRNEGAMEVEVTLQMEGAYRLHSMTRRA